MDLGSPGNGFEELNDLLKDDDSSMVGELGLSFIENREENASNYGFDNLARSNELCVDVNEQGQQAPPSRPSDFPYYDFPRSPEKFQSPLETGFDTVALCGKKNEELLQSPLKDFDQQEGTEEICCSYLSAFPSQVESATPQHELQAEVSGHLVESPLRQAAAQELEMEDRPASPPHEAIMEETFLDMSACESAISEFANQQVEEEVLEHPAVIVHISPRLCVDESETDNDHINHSRNSPLYMSVYEAVISESANEQVQEEVLEHSTEILHTSLRLRVDESETDNDHIRHSRNSPVESRNPVMSLSPRNPEMSIAVDMFPGSVKACSSPESLGSRGQRQRYSPQMSDIVERVDYSLPSGRKDSTSPLRSRQSKRPTDVSSSKRFSISPRNHHLHQNHGRQDRSRSKSPVRRKESYSRQKTKHHDRSRSRSPYKRDYHRSLRRSPRRRHSPRRKSPPSDYHSSRRSPRRKPWSPPHNRSTGLGKPGRILFVAGFSFLTTERDLERKFSRFGRVRDVRIVRDKRSGDSRGFGFLTLDRDEEADAAIRALDKTEWNGRIVLVEKSKSH